MILRRLVILLLLAAAPAAAQASGLDWLVGRWLGQGTSLGKASEAQLDVQPALGGKFVELSYKVTAPGFAFEGRGLYRPGRGADWHAHWFDSRGMALPIEASVTGQELTANWGTAETERGRTLYALRPDGSLEVIDSVLQKDGSWREFARHLFTKSAD